MYSVDLRSGKANDEDTDEILMPARISIEQGTQMLIMVKIKSLVYSVAMAEQVPTVLTADLDAMMRVPAPPQFWNVELALARGSSSQRLSSSGWDGQKGKWQFIKLSKSSSRG
jgi:hypothetical protein